MADVETPVLQSILASAVAKKGRPRMMVESLTFSGEVISNLIKSAGKQQHSTFTMTSSIMPLGYLNDLSPKDKNNGRGF